MIITAKTSLDSEEKSELVNFLYEHLEKYRDSKPDIEQAINYAIGEIPSFCGTIFTARQDKRLVGAVVLNKTGMKGYIPENILVFIATHKELRGKGIGKQLMENAIEMTKGDIALHVEPDNPAKFLYEKFGFTNKYLEMRLKKN